MGSPDGEGEPDEHPQRTVTVTSFELDVSEVTVGAYAACVAKGACMTPATIVDIPGISEEMRYVYSQACNGTRRDRSNHPINCVTLDEAEIFCRTQGKRLPTEEEWEFAARGGSFQWRYPWGMTPPTPKRLNACDTECREMGRMLGRDFDRMFKASDDWPATAPVGSFPDGKSAHGLVDMAGNVLEWTSTPYVTSDKKAVDPRVIRGGCWLDFSPSYVRGAYRNWSNAGARNSFLGFRCARSVGQAAEDAGAPTDAPAPDAGSPP
jgi:formylglycine-generating enzyme required for sulfatase activity